MKSRKIQFVLIILIFATSAPANLGISPDASNTPAGRIERMRIVKMKQNLILVAENQKDAAESESQTKIEINDQSPESEGKTTKKNNKTSGDAKTKSLKTFVPSERIAAEQAVDFPVDI